MVGLSLDEVAHVIALATAPAFLIGSVVSFLVLLIGRMARIIDRVRVLDEIDHMDEKRARLKSDLPRLRRRAHLLHAAMLMTIVSGVLTALVMVIAFIGALTNYDVEAVIAVMFVASLVLFSISLCLLAHETMIALREFKHYL